MSRTLLLDSGGRPPRRDGSQDTKDLQRTGDGRWPWTSGRRLLLALLLATVILQPGIGQASPPIRVTRHSAPSRATFLVLIVLDGARPDYFGLTPLPHVDALRRRGVQFMQAFDGILESETPAGHTALATGSTPRRDGILGFSWAQDDRNYTLFSPDVVRSGAIERIMEQANVPTIAGLYKKVHPKEKIVALSGHKYYAADPLGGPQADAIMYFRGTAGGGYAPTAIPGHVPTEGVLDAPGLTQNKFYPLGTQDDRLATSLAIAAFQKMHPHVMLINMPAFDWPLGHVFGGNRNRARVIQLMRDFDANLGRLEGALAAAHVLHKTLFVITADHGMAPVVRFVPRTIIPDAVKAAGTTAPSISESTGAYVWLANPEKARAVARHIVATHDPGIQSVYYLSFAGGYAHYELAGGTLAGPAVDAANRYLLATLQNTHQPNVVAFCRRDATFSSATSGWKADHGGNGWHSQQIPLIIAGPGVRSGAVDWQPAQLIDVAPTALQLLGVAPTGMEGHVLTDALSRPEVADQRSRSTEVAAVSPVVKALLQQDTFERTHRIR